MISMQFTAAPTGVLHSQVRRRAVSTKTKIADALLKSIREMNRFRYTAFDVVKLTASDFDDTQLPAAQFIDGAETVAHVNRRAERTWAITLEIADKSDEFHEVSQRDMWDLEYEVSRKLWSRPDLGIPGVIQATYLSNFTDLHLLEPYYLLSIQFQVTYYENLTGEC